MKLKIGAQSAQSAQSWLVNGRIHGIGPQDVVEVLAWDGALYAAPQAAANVLRVSHDTAGDLGNFGGLRGTWGRHRIHQSISMELLVDQWKGEKHFSSDVFRV